MSDTSFDLIVVGSGPGGYVAAIRASQLGLRTAIVEREHLGGICLNWGCIPTKALLRCSEINHLLHSLDHYGFSASNIKFDIGKVVARSRQVAGQLSGGVKHLLKKNKVAVIEGHGALNGNGEIQVDNKTLHAQNVLLATGARARTLPTLEPDGKFIWTYKEAMIPPSLPSSLLIVGSGAIGIEFASFYRSLGVEVTVVEMLDRIVPNEDEEISHLARKAFEKQGIRILTEAQVSSCDAEARKVEITSKNGVENLAVEQIILAVGIVGNVEDIGLEKTKVQVEKAHIVVDEWMATHEEGVYAIGDVTGPPWLAHKASHEGILCVERLAKVSGVHPLNPSNIPGCTYSSPQIASIGLTEKQARDKGYAVKVGRFPFIGNGKAIALGESDGLIKTVFDEKSGELLGAHMIGADVTELIQGYGIAKTLETTEQELMHSIFPHPTLSEAMHEAVLSAYGRAIHI